MHFDRMTVVTHVMALIDFHNSRPGLVAIDLETACAVTDCVSKTCKHALDPRSARITDVVISGDVDESAVIFPGSMAPLLDRLRSRVVLHNFRFDFKMLAHLADVDAREIGPMTDTMLLDHLVDENRSHGLDGLVQGLYGDNYKELFWGKYKRYEDAPEVEQTEYACKDVVYTRLAFDDLHKALKAQKVPSSLVEHAHRLALALYQTELNGVAVDLDYTVTMGAELTQDISRTEIELRKIGGFHCEMVELDLWAKEIEKARTPTGKKWQQVQKPAFNFTSSSQVATLLYDQLQLPVIKSHKTKQRTADDAALEELEFRHPIIPGIRELRKFSKMHGAFVEGILDRAVEGRIYPSFNVNGTKTGRISHSDPNLGQMPSKGEWAKIRGIFIPDSGYKLISCDYSQLEVCIAAHYSQDKALLQIINEGLSQHDITAANVGVERGIAKTLNFGMQYLCGPGKVAEVVGCTQARGLEIWQAYWSTYGGLKGFIDWCVKQLDEGKPFRNPFGRLRHFPDFKRPSWSDPSVGKFTKEDRQYFNSAIQGTGSDCTSRAAYLVHEELVSRGWGKLWYTVHDELLVAVKEGFVQDARKLIVETMVSVGAEISLKVPLSVDCSEGLDRWAK